MCEQDEKRKGGESDEKGTRSDPPPAEPRARETAPPAEPQFATSWPERIGYGF